MSASNGFKNNFIFIPHYSGYLVGRNRGWNFNFVCECYIMAGSRSEDGECFFTCHDSLYK